MKAYTFSKYGSISNVSVIERPLPSAKHGHYLVKLLASSINSSDNEMIMGFSTGRVFGLLRPKYHILGCDLVGEIIQVGEGCSHYKKGDKVLCDLMNDGFGAFQEYVMVKEQTLRSLHQDLSIEVAATIPVAGVIAFQTVNKLKDVKPGKSILVNGAGGGMGLFCVEWALKQQLDVTAIDNEYKLQYLRKMGVKTVFDYHTYNFTKDSRRYDFVIDCQGYHRISAYYKILKENGQYFQIGGSMSTILQNVLLGTIVNKLSSKSVKIVAARMNNADDIKMVQALYAYREFQPHIDAIYSFSDLKEALRHYQSGKYVGKIVIRF